MLEKELIQKGLEVMEEELNDLRDDVSSANHDITSILEQIDSWKDTLKEAHKKHSIAEEKYEKKVVELKEARKLIKC